MIDSAATASASYEGGGSMGTTASRDVPFDIKKHTKIARKEARESRFWLNIVTASDLLRDPEVQALAQEADELVRILSGIITSATRR